MPHAKALGVRAESYHTDPILWLQLRELNPSTVLDEDLQQLRVAAFGAQMQCSVANIVHCVHIAATNQQQIDRLLVLLIGRVVQWSET